VSWSAFAADDMTDMGDESPVEAGVEDLDGAAETDSKSSMMRQISPVAGYRALSVAGQDIDAAYLEESLGERHGAIVLFHDQGEAFESNGVITPLRHQLAEHGWSTLTLTFDLPFEPNVMLSASVDKEAMLAEGEETDDVDASEEEAETQATEDASGDVNDDVIDNTAMKADLPPVPNLERVEAALGMLQAKGIKRVIFLGHGKGAEVAIDMLDSQTLPVAGLILVGLSDVDVDDDFKGLEIPVLEVYGTQDLSGVAMAIKQRKAIMKRVAKPNYAVRQILGANHVFYGLEPMLLMTVRSWLKATFIEPGRE
jgi:hypothetical protein